MAHEEDSILSYPGTKEMSRHVNDYSRFTSLFKWGAIVCLAVGFVVLFLIS